MATTIEITEVDAAVERGAILIADERRGLPVVSIDSSARMTVVCFCGEIVDRIDPTGWECALGHGEGLA